MASAEVKEKRRRTGAMIKQLCDEQGIRQYELADRVHISAPYLSQIVKGERGGTAETLSSIAVELGVPLEVLLGKGAPEERAVPA